MELFLNDIGGFLNIIIWCINSISLLAPYSFKNLVIAKKSNSLDFSKIGDNSKNGKKIEDVEILFKSYWTSLINLIL